MKRFINILLSACASAIVIIVLASGMFFIESKIPVYFSNFVIFTITALAFYFFIENKFPTDTDKNNSDFYHNIPKVADIFLYFNTLVSVSLLIYSSINYSGSNIVEIVSATHSFLFAIFVTSVSMCVGVKLATTMCEIR